MLRLCQFFLLTNFITGFWTIRQNSRIKETLVLWWVGCFFSWEDETTRRTSYKNKLILNKSLKLIGISGDIALALESSWMRITFPHYDKYSESFSKCLHQSWFCIWWAIIQKLISKIYSHDRVWKFLVLGMT